ARAPRSGRAVSSERCPRWVRVSTHYALHSFQYPAGLEGLHYEVPGSGLDGFNYQCLLSHGAAHEDARGRITLRDLAYRIYPAHVGHNDVHRHQVRLEAIVLLDCLHSGFRLSNYVEAVLGENVANHGAHEDGVITYEDGVLHDLLAAECRSCRCGMSVVVRVRADARRRPSPAVQARLSEVSRE